MRSVKLMAALALLSLALPASAQTAVPNATVESPGKVLSGTVRGTGQLIAGMTMSLNNRSNGTPPATISRAASPVAAWSTLN